MFTARKISPSLMKFYRNIVGTVALPYVPPTKWSKLTNGIRVVSEETGAGLAVIGMYFQGGPRYETPERNGITYFFEHLAYKSFTNMTKSAFEFAAESRGVRFEAFTDRTMTGFYAKGMPQDSGFVIEMLANVLFESQLDEYEMRDEKCVICQELLDNEQDYKKLVFDYLHQAAYQGTPLAQTVEGPTSNIANFTKEMIQNYMCEQFQPWRMVIVASGAVNHDDILKHVMDRFGTYEPNPCVDDPCIPYRFTGAQVNFRNDAMPLAHVALAVEAPGLTSVDYIPMLVASSVVGSWCRSQGGNEKNGSSLARAMSCAGHCEFYESFYIAYKDTGLWGIYLVAEGLHLDDAVFCVQDQWMNLCTLTTSAESDRGVANTKLLLGRRLVGPENSCRDLAEQVLFKRKWDNLADHYVTLSNVKTHAIKAVASNYIYDKCPAVASVGPTEALPDYTRLRASMYWLRM